MPENGSNSRAKDLVFVFHDLAGPCDRDVLDFAGDELGVSLWKRIGLAARSSD